MNRRSSDDTFFPILFIGNLAFSKNGLFYFRIENRKTIKKENQRENGTKPEAVQSDCYSVLYSCSLLDSCINRSLSLTDLLHNQINFISVQKTKYL